MDSKRASVFDDEGDLDVSGFAPRPAEKPRALPEQVKAISEAASFVSRESKRKNRPAEPGRREPRRHRTGRNTQLNIKAQPQTIDRFYRIADKQGWVLGEAFERAVAALDKELPSGDTR
jgi:hypothetical protein